MSFDNCGKQIKTFAKVMRWLMIVVGLVLLAVGLVQVLFDDSWSAVTGWVVLGSGAAAALVGWIGSLLVYGFGVIVEANEQKTGKTDTPAAPVRERRSVQPVFKEESHAVSKTGGSCPICGQALDPSMRSCPHCAKKPAASKLKTTADGWICAKCAATNPHHVGSCQSCGETKPY